MQTSFYSESRPGKGSVSLDPNYALVKVLRARPGHEDGDQEEGKNGREGAIVQTANRGHFADVSLSCEELLSGPIFR